MGQAESLPCLRGRAKSQAGDSSKGEDGNFVSSVLQGHSAEASSIPIPSQLATPLDPARLDNKEQQQTAVQDTTPTSLADEVKGGVLDSATPVQQKESAAPPVDHGPPLSAHAAGHHQEATLAHPGSAGQVATTTQPEAAAPLASAPATDMQPTAGTGPPIGNSSVACAQSVREVSATSTLSNGKLSDRASEGDVSTTPTSSKNRLDSAAGPTHSSSGSTDQHLLLTTRGSMSTAATSSAKPARQQLMFGEPSKKAERKAARQRTHQQRQQSETSTGSGESRPFSSSNQDGSSGLGDASGEPVQHVGCSPCADQEVLQRHPGQGIVLAQPPVPRPDSPCAESSSSEELEILEAPAGSDVENVLSLICNIYQAPVSMVGAVHTNRVFLKQQLTGSIPAHSSEWQKSLCTWALDPKLRSDVRSIRDVANDDSFRELECVKADPQIKFFFSAPLQSDEGTHLGTLCFVDFKPREMDEGNLLVMGNLKTMLVKNLERDMALSAERVGNQETLANMNKEFQRTLDMMEKCVMFVDPSPDVWKVLYVNAAWERLTGVPNSATLGKPTWELFEHPYGSDVAWANYVPAIEEGREFAIEQLVLKQNRQKTVNLKFKLAKEDAFANALGGLPSFITEQSGGKHNYFVTVEDAATATSDDSNRATYAALTKHAERIEGLELFHIIGKGAFGSVYYGLWFGSPCAVKMIDNRVVGKVDKEGMSLEALMGLELDHPHIVKTIKCVTRSPIGSGPNPSQSTSRDNRITSSMDDTTDTGTLKESSNPAMLSASHSPGPSAGAQTHAAGMKEESGDSTASTTAGLSADQSSEKASSSAANSMNHSSKLPSPYVTPGNRLHHMSGQSGMGATSADYMAGLTPGGAGGMLASLGNSTQPQFNSGDVGETWLVLEFCNKGTLQDALDKAMLKKHKESGEATPDLLAIVHTAWEVSSAMQYLHSQGIVHGDLTAWNIMLTSGPTQPPDLKDERGFIAKVADFGLSRTMDTRSKIKTRTYGTITHMPPEVLISGIISKAADVFSFGVLLWQMYTSSKPWAGMNHGQIIFNVGMKNLQLVFPKGAPPEIRELALACMSQEPSMRPTFEAVTKRLEDIRACYLATVA